MNDPIKVIQDLAQMVDGKIEEITLLPDNSGFAVMSTSLRKDHWLTAEGYPTPPMPFRTGIGPQRDDLAAKIRLAAKYAVRATTENGKQEDFDPDAMVSNFVVGMLGYWTADGTSNLCGDPYDNPDPIPPLFL